MRLGHLCLVLCVSAAFVHATTLPVAQDKNDGVLDASTLIGLDCDVDANSPKCRQRTGPAKIPGSKQYLAIARELYDSIFGDDMINEFRGHLFNSYQQLIFIKDSMIENQGEIEEVVQHLLPNAQRRSLQLSESIITLREKLAVVDAQIHQHSQSLPRSDLVAKERRNANIITTLHRMKNDIVRENTPSSESEDNVLLQVPPDQTLEGSEIDDSLLLQATAQSTEKPAQTTEEAQTTEVAETQTQSQSQSQSQGSDVEDSALVQVTAQHKLKLANENLVDKVTTILDTLIESLKEVRKVERDQMEKKRENWSTDLEDLQERMESIMTESSQRQSEVYRSMVFSRKLRKYLKEITAYQYRSLDMYTVIQNHISGFGENLDRATRMRGKAVPRFQELIYLLENGMGDTPTPTFTLKGCDGFGAKPDACGVCRADNLTCSDCLGEVLGGRSWDVCATCGDGKASECRYFCDGVANSGRMEDVCGICNGNDMTCSGCDGIPHSSRQFDMCGVCAGDGASCVQSKGCSNVVCPGKAISCPVPKTVTPDGYHGCCFEPEFDCVVDQRRV